MDFDIQFWKQCCSVKHDRMNFNYVSFESILIIIHEIYLIIVVHPTTCSQHSIVSGFCFFWDALYRYVHGREISLSSPCMNNCIFLITIRACKDLPRSSFCGESVVERRWFCEIIIYFTNNYAHLEIKVQVWTPKIISQYQHPLGCNLLRC